MSDKNLIWCGRPSQVLNLVCFFWLTLIIVFIVLAAPIVRHNLPEFLAIYITQNNVLLFCGVFVLYGFWRFLVLFNHKYQIYADTIYLTKGVFSPVRDICDMYRVKDETVSKPIYLRIFGLGNIHLVTSDHSSPMLDIVGIGGVDKLVTSIRSAKMDARKKHGVREFD